MAWFEHRHYWRPKTDINKIMSREKPELAQSILIIEDCRCGAVRTLEIEPGRPPVIRMAYTK